MVREAVEPSEFQSEAHLHLPIERIIYHANEPFRTVSPRRLLLSTLTDKMILHGSSTWLASQMGLLLYTNTVKASRFLAQVT